MSMIIRGMNLSENDLMLLRYLHGVKVSTYEKIKRDVYPRYHLASVCNRIYRMERNGLVVGVRNRMLAQGKRCLSLTPRGFSEFVGRGDEVRIELKSDAINHDLALVDVRFWLRQASRVKQYHSENELQTWKESFIAPVRDLARLNSDAVLMLAFPRGEVIAPLEFESSSKSKERYEDVVKKYYGNNDVALVLYLCDNAAVLKKVANVENTLCQGIQPKFFYKEVKDPIANEDFTFHNHRGQTLNLHHSAAYEQVTK